MKLCLGCNTVKETSEFSLHNIRLGRRQSRCKSCCSAASALDYAANATRRKARSSQNKAVVVAENQMRMLDYLVAHPCVECGFSHPAALHFDHVRGVKTKEVSVMVGNGTSWARITEEIAKCDVVCANHHAIRTARQQNWYSNV